MYIITATRRLLNVLVIGLQCVLVFAAFAQSYATNEPWKNYIPSGYVNDYTNTLNDNEKQQLETQLTKINQERNAQGGVAIVVSLDGIDIETYAYELFKQWSIGEKNLDNGFLLLIAKNDRRARIEIGRRLEGTINDARAGRILDVGIPFLRNNNYSTGISTILNEMDRYLASDIETRERIEKANPNNFSNNAATIFDRIGVIFLIAITVLPWAGAILARSRSWWLGGVFGGITGIIPISIFGLFWTGILSTAVLILLGLLFDWIVSQDYKRFKPSRNVDWWAGGNTDWWFDSTSWGSGGSSSSSSWGGFGGGSSGGGGASRSW